jgi:small-conductance mechanosensitive channel
MNNLKQMIAEYTGIPFEMQGRIFLTLGAFIFLYIVRFVILLFIYKSHISLKAKYKWKKSTIYISTILFFIVAGRIWLEGISNLMTYMGLLSAGLAVALKQPIENIVGWWFILWKKPFEVGDRVQIGDHRGDVIDQQLLMFSLMEIGNWVDAEQSTGRVIHIPNGEVFKTTIANYHHGFSYIWNEIPVIITFESDWRLAHNVLTRVIGKHSKSIVEKANLAMKEAAEKYLIFYQKLTPIVYTSVKDSGVLLTVRYLCEPRRRRETESDIWRHIISEFEKYDTIDLAYPTIRYYDSFSEKEIMNVDEERCPRSHKGKDI